MSILSHYFFDICLKYRQHLPEQPCILCGTLSADGVWCSDCDKSLPLLASSHCPVCALPALNNAVCGNCLKTPPHFKRTVAAYAYAFPLDKLMLALKYSEQLNLAKRLGDKLVQNVIARPDCLVAMPLHPARLKERGFNQSLQLARHVGKQLKLPVLISACQRVRDTPSQSTLPWKERRKNMRKAFACSSEVAGKHVAVVDDVMTTGATLNELSMALLDAGATEVSAWVVARTLPHTGKR